MNFKQIMQEDSQKSCNAEGSLRNKSHPWLRRSLRSMRRRRSSDVTAPEMLSRRPKQVTRCQSNSLVDYSDLDRTRVVLEKQDNETFGFEIQTYGMQHRSSTMVEMCTFVCKVQEDSAAQRAGLNTGDVIVTVNGVCTEGADHQHIVTLIRESANILTLETVSGTVAKRIELEKKLRSLKQSLKEKVAELHALTFEELRITGADLNGDSYRSSLGSPMSLASPVGQGSCRLSSASSCRSVMTEDGEDSASLSYMFDYPSPSDTPCKAIANSTWETCPDSIGRTGGGGSLSSSSDLWGISLFATLPRKAKQVAVRKRVLKFIPGLNNSVEEEVDS
ncbi:cytohesin-interacting protein [Scleropages formosus]|uniref:Cytohesin 1 interacting protein n=1 Tax=Scleropages formosus TaxID=113540 RepID=A0A8C9V8S9_SCLFO|nr:cytohesin-interacting protein [Scleropages formosus]